MLSMFASFVAVQEGCRRLPVHEASLGRDPCRIRSVSAAVASIRVTVLHFLVEHHGDARYLIYLCHAGRSLYFLLQADGAMACTMLCQMRLGTFAKLARIHVAAIPPSSGQGRLMNLTPEVTLEQKPPNNHGHAPRTRMPGERILYIDIVSIRNSQQQSVPLASFTSGPHGPPSSSSRSCN